MGVRVQKDKHKPGRWWVRIHHHGLRKSLAFNSRKAAALAADRIDAGLKLGHLGVLAPHAARVPTFAEVAEEWLTRYPLIRSVSPNTMDNYTSFTRHHLLPYFGRLPVSAIGYKQIEAFIAEKRGPRGSRRSRGQPLSQSSLRVGLVALRLILDRAVKAGMIPANPAVGVARFSRTDEDRLDPFTGEELRAIFAAAERLDPTYATFLRAWAQSGMRQGEVSALQNQDLDLDRGRVVVRRSWSRQRLGPTKTRRTRVVSLGHPVSEDTLEWRPGLTPESRRILAMLRALPVRSLEPGDFLFGIKHPWATWAIQAQWRRVLGAVGVRYRNPEQLRHTFASTLLSRNAPLLYVQQQGGWQSAAVLLRVYARWLPQGQVDATPAQPGARGIQPIANEIADFEPLSRPAGTSRSS